MMIKITESKLAQLMVEAGKACLETDPHYLVICKHSLYQFCQVIDTNEISGGSLLFLQMAVKITDTIIRACLAIFYCGIWL